MKIFITGGSGFIGSQVVAKLKKSSHKLLILSNKSKVASSSRAKTVNGNLSNISKWSKVIEGFKPDAAIHIAWEGLPDHSYDLSKKNFINSLNLFEKLAEINCKKVVIVGSGWEYGRQEGKVSESTPLLPFDSFTAAKHSLYWMGREIAKQNNQKFIWTRLFYVYGPGQHPKSLVPYLIDCAVKNIQPEIRNPDAQNDFVFVGDAADALIKLVESETSHDLYNVGSGKLTKVSTIIKTIFNQFKQKVNFKKGERDNRDNLKEFYADISRIKKDLGWRPETSIACGVVHTIEYYKKLKS